MNHLTDQQLATARQRLREKPKLINYMTAPATLHFNDWSAQIKTELLLTWKKINNIK